MTEAADINAAATKGAAEVPINFVITAAGAPHEHEGAIAEEAIAEEEAVPVKKGGKGKGKRKKPTENEFQKKPFQDLVRDIAATCNGGDAMRVGTEAFDLIQMAGERLLAEIMADAWRITLNRGAKTVQAGDFNLAVELRRNKVLVNYTPAAVVLEDIHEEEEDEEDSSSEGEGESEEY